jgi:hypothetical protein
VGDGTRPSYRGSHQRQKGQARRVTTS